MNRVATLGYLRYPHVHGDLLTFVTEDDVWLAPAQGGRAWRLTSDGGQAGNPRFSPDGAPADAAAPPAGRWPAGRGGVSTSSAPVFGKIRRLSW